MTAPQLTLTRIATAVIDMSPFNPRHEAVDIEGLAASIAEVGIIEPLVVAIHDTEPGRYTVVCGSRRLAASRLAGLKKVPCQVMEASGERVQRTVSAVENLHRRDMTHIEQGEAFRDLMRTGMTQIEVARALGVSDYTVSVKLNLVTNLIPEMRELVHSERMTLREALDLAKLPATTQRQLLKRGQAGQRRKTKDSIERRPYAEASLMRAVSAFRAENPDLALAEARTAVRHLERMVGPETADCADEGPPPSPVPDGSPAGGRVKCPHCNDAVKVRSGLDGPAALQEHAVDRPFCRATINGGRS